MSANRNKESIVLDLKAPDDGCVLERLVARSDVLLENFRTGVLDRLGFPVARLHELNPGLVIGSISGFGHDGPEAGRAGYDQIAQGEGGLMSVTGVGEPTKVGVPIADLLAGMNLAYGVLAALHERTRTGRGRVVRTSLLAGIVGVHAFQGTRWTIAGEVPGLSGSHHPAIAPYGMFATATVAGAGGGGVGGPVAEVRAGARARPGRRAVRHQPRPGRPPRRADRRDRGGLRDRAGRALARRCCSASGIPAGKVRSLDDVYAWEQTRSQGLLLDVDHPAYGPLTLAGSPIRFEDNTFSGGRPEHRPPPLLDEHGAAIREWLDWRLTGSPGATGDPVDVLGRCNAPTTSGTTREPFSPGRRSRRPGRRRRGPGGRRRPTRRRPGRR